MLKIKVLLLFLLISNLYSGEIDKLKWTQTANEDQIKIWDAPALKSGHVPVRGEVLIDGSMEKVLAVLSDTKNKPEWLTALRKAKVIKDKSDYNRVEYYEVKMPTFLISDRTFSFEYDAVVNPKDKSVFVNIKSSDKYLKRNDKFVRANLRDSSMTIEYVVNKKGKKLVKVTGIFFTSPKGLIPNWVVTRFTRSLAKESLRKFREVVKKRKYPQTRIQEIAKLIEEYPSKGLALNK
ncbi:START domain-containing protein [Bacteriovoracaceae bacterium]|nr:START domain-containing protein [Bacteriovoracaceae bacterium]